MCSPKDKFIASIHHNKPLKGVGSVESYSANSIDELDIYIKYRDFKHCRVVIKENKAEYPQFNWDIIKIISIN